MRFRGYCWSPSVIRNYVPTRIFSVCRRNWKGQRTESRSSAAISTARCKTTMWLCAVSQQIWWLACLAFRRNRFSPRKRAQNGRRRCSLTLAHRLLPRLQRPRRRKVILDPAVVAGVSPAIQQPTRLPLQGFRPRQLGLFIAAFAGLLPTCLHAAEVIPPKPDRYFNDYAGVVSREAAQRFNEQLAQFERETSDQVVVAVFPKMQSDSDIADYTQRVAQAWGVGQKERRNGIVLFVFIQDRKIFIQVGYGLEGALPDATAFDITERRIKPLFRNGDYQAGLATGIDLICKAIRGEYKGSGKTVADQHRRGGASGLLPFLIFVIVLIIISRLMRRLGGYGYSSGRDGPIFLPMGGGGGWSSGGGGGGFSGFSGGGGSFGGGGAGSSW